MRNSLFSEPVLESELVEAETVNGKKKFKLRKAITFRLLAEVPVEKGVGSMAVIRD